MSKALTKLKPKTLGKQLSKVAGVNGGYAPSAGSLLYWDFRNTPDSVASMEINSNVECVTEGSTSVRYIPQTTSGNYLAVPASTPAYNRGVGLWSEDVATNYVGNTATETLAYKLATNTSATVAGMTGKSITADTSNDGHGIAHATPTASTATDLTCSFIVSTTERYIALTLNNNDGANFATAVIDLQTGSQTDSAVGGTSGTVNSSGADELGTNLYRVWMNAQIGTFANGGGAGIFFSDSGTPSYTIGGVPSFTGAGEALSYAIPQVEAGSYYSSPIPTSGSPVTRIACSTMADLAASGLTFPANDYDLVIKGKLNKIPADGVLFAAINATTPNDDYLAIFIDDSTTVRAAHENSTVAATDISVTVPAISVGDTFTCTLNKRSTGNSTLTWNATSNTGSTNWGLDTDAQELNFSAHGALGCGSASEIDVEIYNLEVIDAS